jgi:hypothetical protein
MIEQHETATGAVVTGENFYQRGRRLYAMARAFQALADFMQSKVFQACELEKPAYIRQIASVTGLSAAQVNTLLRLPRQLGFVKPGEGKSFYLSSVGMGRVIKTGLDLGRVYEPAGGSVSQAWAAELLPISAAVPWAIITVLMNEDRISVTNLVNQVNELLRANRREKNLAQSYISKSLAALLQADVLRFESSGALRWYYVRHPARIMAALQVCEENYFSELDTFIRK